MLLIGFLEGTDSERGIAWRVADSMALRSFLVFGLTDATTLGVDATTLEANAAMRSIVRRESGESYEDYLNCLAKASGIETPARSDLARFDRKCKDKKTSNDDWENLNDPDARITKMKDGRTHLAHKAEHAVDMETSAVVGVTVQPTNRGDTSSLAQTLDDRSRCWTACSTTRMRRLV